MKPIPAEHDPDRPVFEAVQQGDPHALAELMERQGRWVRGAIFGVLGRMDEVDDVAQRVWMQVWREARRLEDTSRWRVWLYRIARNAAADAGRSKQRRKRLLDGVVRRRATNGDTVVRPDQALARDEQRDTMLEAIAALPELYREPFVLKHLENWSYQEIADAIGSPVDTIETRLVRARRLLRQELAGKV